MARADRRSGGKTDRRDVPCAINRSPSRLEHEDLRQRDRPSHVDRLSMGVERHPRPRGAKERHRELRRRVGGRGRELGLDRAAERDVGHDRQDPTGDHAGGRGEPPRRGHLGLGRSVAEAGRAPLRSGVPGGRGRGAPAPALQSLATRERDHRRVGVVAPHGSVQTACLHALARPRGNLLHAPAPRGAERLTEAPASRVVDR